MWHHDFHPPPTCATTERRAENQGKESNAMVSPFLAFRVKQETIRVSLLTLGIGVHTGTTVP